VYAEQMVEYSVDFVRVSTVASVLGHHWRQDAHSVIVYRVVVVRVTILFGPQDTEIGGDDAVWVCGGGLVRTEWVIVPTVVGKSVLEAKQVPGRLAENNGTTTLGPAFTSTKSIFATISA
jgi:hypothetical protein